MLVELLRNELSFLKSREKLKELTPLPDPTPTIETGAAGFE